LGYHPQIILAGRRINDKMGEYIAQQIIKKMIKKSIPVNNAKAAILGITFKENCPDIRNSKVISIVEELEDFGVKVDIFDPNASSEDVKNEYGRHLGKNISAQELETYDTIVFAVAHSEYREIPINDDWKKSKVIYDVKGILPKGKSDLRL
jgi:UDP-N-acetyl-D-galactosamine dehydrogenase